MSTDGPNPPPCDNEIYKNGCVVHVANSISSKRIENWVKSVAEKSGQRVDWHRFAGSAVVKALGDLAKVGVAIETLLPELERLRQESLADMDALFAKANAKPA